MQERISLWQNLFYIGLVVMLLAAIASATGESAGSPLLAGLLALGGVLALTARLWVKHLQHTLREHTNHRSLWAAR